jgi:hypothetical protein
LLEDVTIPDDTRLLPGQAFTKTWRLQNTGSCPWIDYSLAFASGDRMTSPESVAIALASVGEQIDLSVDLVAPSSDGLYTGYFEPRTAPAMSCPSASTLHLGRIHRPRIGSASTPGTPAVWCAALHARGSP